MITKKQIYYLIITLITCLNGLQATTQKQYSLEKAVQGGIKSVKADVNQQLFSLAKNRNFGSIQSLLGSDSTLSQFKPKPFDDGQTFLDLLIADKNEFMSLPGNLVGDAAENFTIQQILFYLLKKGKITLNKSLSAKLLKYMNRVQSYSLLDQLLNIPTHEKIYKPNIDKNFSQLLKYLLDTQDEANKLFLSLAIKENYSLIHDLIAKHPQIKQALALDRLDERDKTFIDYLVEARGSGFSWGGPPTWSKIALLDFLVNQKVVNLSKEAKKNIFFTACKIGDKKLLAYTLEQGVASDTKNSKNQNGIMLGAIAQKIEIINLILKNTNTLTIDDEDTDGKTALMLLTDTIRNRNYSEIKDFITTLLSEPYNANINHQSKKSGRTLLMDLVSKKLHPITSILNDEVDSQEVPLEKIKDLVENKGANPHLTDKKGEKAYDLALKAGNQKIADYLKKVSSQKIQNKDLKQKQELNAPNKNSLNKVKTTNKDNQVIQPSKQSNQTLSDSKDNELNQNDIHDIKDQSIEQVNNNDKNKNRNLTLIIIVTLGIGSTIIGGFYWYLTKHSRQIAKVKNVNPKNAIKENKDRSKTNKKDFCNGSSKKKLKGKKSESDS